MINSRLQTGSALIVIIVIVVIAILGTLGYVVWNNFFASKDQDMVQEPVAVESVEETPNDEVTLVEYSSFTDSGLKFTYPEEWSFEPPTEVFTNIDGGESVTFSLYSEAPQLDPNAPAPVTTNQYMCVTITEYKGDWAYHNSVNPANEIRSETFKSGADTYYMKTYKEYSLGRDGKPMGNVIRLLSGSSENGLPLNYIQTNEGFVFEAVAQYNCMQGGEGIKNLNDDFFAQPQTAQAVQILKSLQFNALLSVI